jgi:hypothetical protein
MALSSQLGTSKELLDWWKTNSAPYQIGLMEKGLSLYDDAALTDDDYSRELGLVSGDVARSFGRSRDATGREMLSYGLNPSSGRFASMLTASGNQQAAAEAAARNAARRGLSDTEFARKSSALGLASGLNTPNYGLVGTGMGGLSSAAGGYGSMAGSMDASNQAILSGLFAGAGAAFGGTKGFGMFKADGKEVKSRKRRRKHKNGYADGRGVREKFMGEAERVDRPGLSAVEQIRGEVRGPGTPISDDIPVATEEGEEARLADGEVVIPTDTTAAIGLSFYRADPEAAMHKLGVAVLEEIIDETHVPAEVQSEQGLSVDPRGVEDGAHDDERVGYADGGQSGWGLGLSMLGHGLANAYSRGGWLEGVRAGRRAANQEEEAEFMRGQRERMLAEQGREDEYRKASEQAIADATQYQDPAQALDDPEFGIAAQTGDPSALIGLRLAHPDPARAVAGLRTAQAKYDPRGYLSAAADAAENKAEREFKERELDLKYGDQFAVSGDWIYNKRTGEREVIGKGDGAGRRGGWKLDEVDKQAFSMAARALGIDNMVSMTPADEARVAETASAIRNEFMRNPEAGLNNAYQRFIYERSMNAPLTEEELAAAAQQYNEQSGRASNWLPFDEVGSDHPEVQRIAMENRRGATSAPQQDPLLAAMQARRQSQARPQQTANTQKASAPAPVPKPTKGEPSRLARSVAMDAFNAAERAVKRGNITPAMARAQLKRLEGIDSMIDRNMSYDLRQLRAQLQRVATNGAVGLTGVR